MYKTPRLRSTFKNCDVEKVHIVVARSTCPSQNVQNTPCSDHFWKLRCGKSARCCGTKHMSKSKCTKHLSERFWKLRCRKVHADAARGRCSTRDIFIGDVGRAGFRKGCIFEHQMFRFALMILGDRCSTSYDLASPFRGRLCAQLSIFEGSLAKTASFLMLLLSKPEEVLQNFVILDL